MHSYTTNAAAAAAVLRCARLCCLLMHLTYGNLYFTYTINLNDVEEKNICRLPSGIIIDSKNNN